MAHKKRRAVKNAPIARKFAKRKQKSKKETQLQQAVISFLTKQKQPASLSDILTALHLSRKEKTNIIRLLEELISDRKIHKKSKRYSISSNSEHLLATIVINRKGFGFATQEGQPEHEKDIFIPARDLNGASHGDTIQVSVVGKSRGRREGQVIKVLKRAVKSLYGIFTDNGRGGHVTPDNERIPYVITISKQNTAGAIDGTIVKTDIIDYGSEHIEPTGKIVELLGDPYDAQIQIRLAIAEHSLREVFPESVLEETKQFAPLETCEQGRKDLRDIQHVTIDGADARDFDDAICVEKNEKGFTLYVSIADVSYYVTPGSAVDREAYLRGTSVYLPDRVLPMLPEKLSNNLCSLVPNEPRPSFTAILFFDKQGHRIKEKYTKSLIQSCQRFTYDTVNELLYQGNVELQQTHTALMPMLTNCSELADLLKKKRMQRGSLGFNIPEPSMVVDKSEVTSITLSDRNQAHMLIEEFMLAANEATAETLSSKAKPVLFRIHEDPDTTKLENFTDVCKMLSVELPKKQKDSAWFADILSKTEGSKHEYIINNLLLRSMQQARYSPQNSGHFGLAAEHYLHFTSPIRRYPDLIAHRALQGYLAKEEHTVLFPDQSTQPLTEAAKKLSLCERTAIKVSRNTHARLAVLFLRERVGEKFPAIISGVTSFGLFIELQQYYISGGIPIKTMTNDYYLHDAKRHRLIGEATNKMYQLGDNIEVILDHADILGKRLTFSLAEIQSDDYRKS